jgi:hypothetical protein
VRKLLIINDAWPNNTTAGSFIKDKMLLRMFVFSVALDSFWPSATRQRGIEIVDIQTRESHYLKPIRPLLACAWLRSFHGSATWLYGERMQ